MSVGNAKGWGLQQGSVLLECFLQMTAQNTEGEEQALHVTAEGCVVHRIESYTEGQNCDCIIVLDRVTGSTCF